MAANYRAACRARSRREFVAKLGLVVEEADESQGWLRMLIETGLMDTPRTRAALAEATELTAIFTSSHRTARRNLTHTNRVPKR